MEKKQKKDRRSHFFRFFFFLLESKMCPKNQKMTGTEIGPFFDLLPNEKIENFSKRAKRFVLKFYVA
jgi:hypothetical protein